MKKILATVVFLALASSASAQDGLVVGLGNFFSPTYSPNNCEANAYPFSSGNKGNGNYYAGPAERLQLHHDGLHLTYDAQYNDISPGFVSIPGFINRVDIREVKQEVDYRFRPKHGWIVDWGPTLNLRHDFDHTGLRLDTDYSPYLAIQGRAHTIIYLHPYEEFRERLRPQDFCFYGYCPSPPLPNQDYHEHTSGATFQTGYFKKATIVASYYWGDAVNFVALPASQNATPYNQPFVAREDNAQASLIVRPFQPLKIENTYLFDRLRAGDGAFLAAQSQFPGAGRGIFNDFPVVRHFLDIHAARAHYANNPDQFGKNFGGVMLGRDNTDFFI